jgi:hypothetical protein
MRRVLAALALSLASFLHAADTREPAAAEAARKEFEAMGGKSWEAARYFRFDFVVDLGEKGRRGPYAHHWDRYTGRYRVDVPGEKGYTAYFDVNSPKDAEKAVILRGGARLAGEDAAKALANAYGRFINDSYWLLAPLKSLDPGVNLADEGEVEAFGRKAHVIRLSFNGVGLTPGDVYRHFLDPETHEMLGWEYQLQNTQPPPTRWKWDDVQTFAGLKLSLRKSPDDPKSAIKAILFENVAVAAAPDEKALVPPAP